MQLRAADGPLELAATDMELSLRASVEADVSGAGTVVVPGRLLLDIARSLPESEATLEHLADESVLVITSGSRATASTPTRPRTSRTCRISVRCAATGRRRGAPLHDRPRLESASRDESRPVLTGSLRQLRGREARDGRDRLLPARGQGDGGPGRRSPRSRRSSRLERSRSCSGSPARPTRSSSHCRRTTSSSAPATSG